MQAKYLPGFVEAIEKKQFKVCMNVPIVERFWYASSFSLLSSLTSLPSFILGLPERFPAQVGYVIPPEHLLRGLLYCSSPSHEMKKLFSLHSALMPDCRQRWKKKNQSYKSTSVCLTRNSYCPLISSLLWHEKNKIQPLWKPTHTELWGWQSSISLWSYWNQAWSGFNSQKFAGWAILPRLLLHIHKQVSYTVSGFCHLVVSDVTVWS